MPSKMVSGLREEMIDPPGLSRFLGIDLVDSARVYSFGSSLQIAS